MFYADYPIVWLIYLVVSFIAFLAGYFLFKGLYKPINHILLILLAVALFSTTLINNQNDFLIYAPSSIIVILDLVLKIGNFSSLAITNLILHATLSLLIYLLIVIFIFCYKRRQTVKN